MNAFSKTITGVFATAALVAAIPASAHSDRGHPGIPMMPSFEELDADGDGSVSMDEANSFLDAMIAEQDSDGDGSISAEEFKNAILSQHLEMIAKRSERMFNWLDDNDDGVLSKDEIVSASRFEKMFERLDSDDDGMISKEEFEEMKSKRGKRWKGDRNGKRGDYRDGKRNGDEM